MLGLYSRFGARKFLIARTTWLNKLENDWNDSPAHTIFIFFLLRSYVIVMLWFHSKSSVWLSMMIWLRWEQGPSPSDQRGNCQRDWSNVTRLSSRHRTRRSYRRLQLLCSCSGLKVLNVQWQRSTFLAHPLFLVFFWHPALNISSQRTNRMSDIACGTFASPSPYYILTLRRIGQNSALLTGTRHHDVLRTCVYYMYHGNTVIIGREDREEMVSVWRTDGIIRLS